MKIRLRKLGNTGIKVSEVALGTVSLGVNYGIQCYQQTSQPSEEEAIRMIHAAIEAGVNLIDTAPNYGIAERLVGKGISGTECMVATKIGVPGDGIINNQELIKTIETSLESSRRALKRDYIDIVQVHNMTLNNLADGRVGDFMEKLQNEGKIKVLGVSVYTEEEALWAIKSGWVKVLQIPFNLLDQRMTKRVFAASERVGIGIIGRSVFLKGALTEKVEWLPENLSALRSRIKGIQNKLGLSVENLRTMALKFCLYDERLSSVLLGPGNMAELEKAINDSFSESLSADMFQKVCDVAVNDPDLVDPRIWGIP